MYNCYIDYWDAVNSEWIDIKAPTEFTSYNDASHWVGERCASLHNRYCNYRITTMTESSPNPKKLSGDKKVKLQTIPPIALVYLGEAMEEGLKYGAFNWRDVKVEATSYIGGMFRHLLAYIDGEDVDQEGGKRHLAGIMACCAILLDSEANNTLIDNRSKSKAESAADLIRQLAGRK